MGDVEELAGFRADFADGIGHGSVRVEAVDDDAAVDGEDVPFGEDAFSVRHAMNDLVVDRSAERSRVAVVALEGSEAPSSAIFLTAIFSRSIVEAPGTTWGAMASWTWRRALPEIRIFSISCGVLIMMAISTVRVPQ